jgi:hypothetical protein
VITFSPRSLPGVDPISVRAEGELVVAEDTEVELTTRGSALVWPARGDSHSGSGESAHPAQV